MVVALQFVNRPEDVEAIYKTVNMDSMSLQNCAYCVQRIYVKAFADIELGKYPTAIQNIEMAQKEDETKSLNKPLAIAYVRGNKTEALNQFWRKIEITSTPAETQDLYLQTGKEFLLKNDKTKASEFFNKIINAAKGTLDPKMLSDALFYEEEYTKAEKVLKEIHIKNPDDIEVLAKLAICNFKLGNLSEAEKDRKSIETLRGDYQYGSVDYALSQYYAATDNQPALYKHLLKAAANGHTYTWQFYKNDPQFLKYNTSKEFKEVMDFWK